MFSRKVVKIFLASPGDLVEERVAARNVVDEFNATWADRLGYQVDLVGWEDTVSSHGRPQSIINRELEQCELFYGMLWKRWGTPPTNSGPYTSGFEEEFRLSQERCNKTGRPAIKLAFKRIDQELLRDPGPELAKVIAFRESLVAGKELLFETFDDLANFQSRFRRAISAYVQQLTDSEKNEPEQAAAADSLMADNVTQPHVATELLSLEGARFLRSFIAKTESASDGDAVTAFEVARFRLLGLIATKQGNDEQTLGVHDANIIYESADGTTFGDKEKLGLLDTGFANLEHENTPLWHWYREVEAVMGGNLWAFSLFGPAAVRAGALSAMTLIGQPLNEQPRLDREGYVKSWFSEQAEATVKIAALGYLGAWGITADLPYVRAELDRGDYQTRSAATDAFFSIILRNSRERALEALIELQVDSLSKSVLDELFSIPSSLELASLLKAIEHRNSSVRSAAAKILRERSALPIENSEQLMTDTSADVRMEALLAQKTDGRQFSDAEAKAILVKPSNQGLLGWSDGAGEANYKRLRESQLRQLSEQELNTLIDKHFPLNEAEYVARAETYYEKYGHELKAAVEDEFAAHFKASMRRLAEAVSNDTTRRIEQLGDLLRKSLTRSGLSVIERRQNAEDIGLVRKALGSGFLTWSDSDADYLARFGEWQDIKILSELVEKPDYGSSTLLGFSDNGRYRAAARAINKLSKNRWRELLASPLKDRLMEKVIVELPDKVFRELDYNSLKPLLFSENASVRKVGVLKSIKALTRARIKELLSHYISSEGQRYYNVIHWLDFGVNVPRDRVSLAASRTLARMACRGLGL